jgi:hypothetical protein
VATADWVTNVRAIAAAWPLWHVIIASHDYAKSTEAVRSLIDGSRPQCAELALNPYVNHATAATTILTTYGQHQLCRLAAEAAVKTRDFALDAVARIDGAVIAVPPVSSKRTKRPRCSYAAGMITAFTVSRRDTASSAF